MSILNLAIRTIVQLAQQQIIYKKAKGTGYIFTLKMVNNKGIVYYAHIIISESPSVFILINAESNWRNINYSEWKTAKNTSNHDECWKSSGFAYLEDIWDSMNFNRLEFHTGNFGFKLYEEVKIIKENDGNYLYKLTKVDTND